MKTFRKIIEIDDELCTGCGECVPDCAEGSLAIIDGKARLVADRFCDGMGACLKSCPTGALRIVEREADEFDEKGVDAYLHGKKQTQQIMAGGCPSAQLKTFAAATCETANRPGSLTDSALTHWPVQIRLVPAAAQFLENCDLLVAADCTAAAYAEMHRDFIKGRVVLMGCPKFDDAPLYIDRFTDILQQRTLKSLTVLIMEVPCCSGMLQIIKQARDNAGSRVPVRQVVISVQGKIINDQGW
jgi:NAD-dependent dihydropyrimidine dehydrogenase PreA subunit